MTTSARTTQPSPLGLTTLAQALRSSSVRRPATDAYPAVVGAAVGVYRSRIYRVVRFEDSVYAFTEYGTNDGRTDVQHGGLSVDDLTTLLRERGVEGGRIWRGEHV